MLWKVSDVVSLVAFLVIGAAGVFAGWIGVSGEPRHAEQTAWLNLGIGGLVVAGVGIAVWLLAGRRAIGVRRAELLPDLLVDATTETGERPPAIALVVVPGMSRFHRQDCELVAGKQVRAAAARRSLQPCAVCEPERA